MFKLISLLCFFTLAATALSLNPTLNATLQKNYFFLSPDNHFASEFYQTRNGIITFSIETINQIQQISQYLLINMTSKDVKPILTDLVQACEILPPTYQALHYHAQTDSLAYFCSANNSLLILDQADYNIQATIVFQLRDLWSIFKLSTDGANIAILLMGEFYTSSPLNSILIKVDMQTKKVVSQIVFNQGLGVDEAVVAFASNKNFAYIATNRMEGQTIATTVYLLYTLGNTYQLAPLRTFSTQITPTKILTKLFCIGNLVAVNNYQDLNFIDAEGAVTTVSRLAYKAINSLQKATYFHPVMTSQYGSNDLYIQINFETVSKYTATGRILTSQAIGTFEKMQIAYGNQNPAGDLIFTLDTLGLFFSILDAQTLQPIYNAIAGYNDIMLTNKTYAVVQSLNFHNPHIYIFDLKNDTLISKFGITNAYYYTKEQQIVSFFNVSGPIGSVLVHIDLLTGNTWTTLNFTDTKTFVNCTIPALRITENGNPEFVVQVSSNFVIYTESYGFIQFNFSSPFIMDHKALNMDLESLTFYFYDTDLLTMRTNITYYKFDPSSQQFKLLDTNLIKKVPADYGIIFVNTSTSLALSKTSFAVINNLGNNSETHSFSSDWDYASAFQDSARNQYVILTKARLMNTKGSAPSVFAFGNFTTLPGLRNESIRAQSAGINSYWIADALSSSVGLIRFYKVADDHQRKSVISIQL